LFTDSVFETLCEPLFAVVVDPGNPGPWDVAGAAVFLAGIVIEGVADLQLERFKRDPDSRGRVLDRGLWRYSRHPNYFGNAVLWWGAYLMAVGAGAAWTVVGPILMTYLLLRVSGVTLLERDLRRRKPGYEAYVARTSAFFPWRPRGPEDAERPGERTRAPDRVERSGTGGPDA